MPKTQTKITDAFKAKESSLRSSSSSLSSLPSIDSLNDLSNNFGLSLAIENVMDENNLLDTFINSAINGGVKRNWNIQQLKKTVGDINSEFKPQIEKRTAFWERELEKLNNIKISTIRKSSSQLDIDSNDKSQKTLLDYFTKNEKNQSIESSSNITTIVLESHDVPQDLVIPMLCDQTYTSDLNITTTTATATSIVTATATSSTCIQSSSINGNTVSDLNDNTMTMPSSSNTSSATNAIIEDTTTNTTSTDNTDNTTNATNTLNITTKTTITTTNTITSPSMIKDSSQSNNALMIGENEEEFIKPTTPTIPQSTSDSEMIALNANDLDDLLMEDVQVTVPSILNEPKTETSSPLSVTLSPTLPSITTPALTGSSKSNTSSPNLSKEPKKSSSIIPSNVKQENVAPSITESSAKGEEPITTTSSVDTATAMATATASNTSSSVDTTSVEETLLSATTTPKKTNRKTTSSKKNSNTGGKKTSRKGSKKRKIQDDDAMIDDDDDEYKPSLTDEEDLILDEEIEDDEVLDNAATTNNTSTSGKRKRPSAPPSKKVMTDDDDDDIILNDDVEEITKTTKQQSKTTTTNTTTPSAKSTGKTTSSTATTTAKTTNGVTTSREDECAEAEDDEEIIETPIKTRSARKKTRSGKSATTPSHLDQNDTTSATSPSDQQIQQHTDQITLHKSTPSNFTGGGSTTPTSVNNDIFEDISNSINQSSSPLGFDENNEPQTPANTKKKKRTTTTVRRRKKKPSEDGTSYHSSEYDGGSAAAGDSFLSHEDELYVSTNSNTDTSAPSYQFWDYVNSFFPVIKKDRLQLLEIEHSDDDDAFNISKRGKYYTERWEQENCKLFPNLFKKEQLDNSTTQSLETTSSSSNIINVDKSAKLFFSHHNLTQRLLSSLIEERDLVSVDSFLNDHENSNSSSGGGLVFDSDEESVDEQLSSSARKTTRSTRKSVANTPTTYSSNTFASPAMSSSANIGSSISATGNGTGVSNANSMLDNFSNSFSILEQQQQHEISEHFKQKLPTLSKTHTQKANQVLQSSNQFKDFEQQLFEPSFDYSSQYLNIFEEKLLNEIKSIGLLPPQSTMSTPLWSDEESREDDEICAEIRTLQNKLRMQMDKTNNYRMKILTSVKEQLPEETEIGNKILLFSDLEKKLFPSQQKKR